MGQILSFECEDCNYSEMFYTGSGMMDFASGKQKELFNCPHCGFLSLRTVKLERGSTVEKKQKCSKCGSIMACVEGSPLVLIDGGTGLTCPNCRSNNCICVEVGNWD